MNVGSSSDGGAGEPFCAAKGPEASRMPPNISIRIRLSIYETTLVHTIAMVSTIITAAVDQAIMLPGRWFL